MRDGEVHIDGVRYAYRGAPPVLNDVGATLGGGEVLVVQGRNGAGKTTLLRLVAGTLRPQAGEVRRSGRIGYLPQRSDDPPPRLSVTGWLDAIHHMHNRAGRSDHLEILESLGVDRLTAPMDTLSVGTVAKVLLAGAFGGAPDVVVLDEPFASLDKAAQAAVLSLISSAARAGAAVLVSDHDGAAIEVATSIATISDGKLVVQAAGRPSRVRVVSADASGCTSEVVVETSERDAMLLRLLTGGHQVLRVEETQ